MSREFIIGEPQQERISRLQAALRRSDEPVLLRVWGEAGIGKTRLVLEATQPDDLRPLVVYCTADTFRDSSLMIEMLRGEFYAILVLDECHPENRAYIWNKFKYHSPRIKIISIYNECDKASGIIDINVPSLGEGHISTIIQGYVVPKEKADRWARECDGSPRVAHVIGWNVINNPEDLLKTPDTVNVWERYIEGGDKSDSQEVQLRLRVLRFLSLFKRFGYGKWFENEAKTICKMIEPEVSWLKFQEIVEKLRERRILQGDNTLYITPKMLHIYLWIDWWNTYGKLGTFQTLLPLLSPSLLDFCFEMFEYAAGSEVSSRFVKELLGEHGPFQQDEQFFKTEIGAKFFFALTKAEPETALRCLQNTVGTWSKAELSQFDIGRYSVIQALEHMAMWKDLFADAARLLLALAEFEDESQSNHASSTFVKLFYISWHQELSPTEASPQERFPVLKEALESSSKRHRLLALRACERALRHHFFGQATDVYRVFGREPQLWKPATWGELFDAYRQVWEYLFYKLEGLPEDERQKACDIFLENAYQLARIENLTTMVINTIDELSKKPYADKENILEKILWILRREKLSEETRQRWKQIKQSLTGTDFHSLMKRYVGMRILGDNYDEEGKQTNLVQQKIEELAQQAFTHQELFHAELDWLVTTEAQNGYYFGHALGKEDSTFSLLPTLLEAQRRIDTDPSVAFLGGYLRRVFEQNRQKWEDVLDNLMEDGKLSIWIPELIFRSGELSDNNALRILHIVKMEIGDIDQFRMFIYGNVLQKLSEPVFRQWIEYLLSHSNIYAIHIAIDLYHAYFLRKEFPHTLPEALTWQLLTHPSLFQRPEKNQYTQMTSHQWGEIGKAFVGLYPGKSLELADIILEHFGEETPIFHSMFSPAQIVLLGIIQQNPEEIWARITRYLESPKDMRRAYELEHWLKGYDFPDPDMEGGGILPMFPIEIVWRWVDENVEEHAPYFAKFVPKQLFREEERLCWMREFLARYGDRKAVRDRLIESFLSYGWTGSQSVYLQNKRQELLDFKKEEENENVRRWIDEYVAVLEQDMERAKIEEERRGF